MRQAAKHEATSELALAAMLSDIRSLVRNVAPGAELAGRVKDVGALVRKAERIQTHTSLVHDSIGIRIIVNSRAQCYRIVELIHRRFQYLEAEYDDYIETPKPNGYQSLHTTVLAGGRSVEIQLRTHTMHACAEAGRAAHWRYKQVQGTGEA